jgi:hypothetical protein
MAFAIISNLHHDMARAIFYAFDAYSGKKNLLKRVLDTGINEADTKLVNRIMKAVEKTNNQRTELSHAAFLFENDGTRSFTLYRPKNGKAVPVTSDSLRTWREHSFTACEEASRAFQQLSEKHQRQLTIGLK